MQSKVFNDVFDEQINLCQSVLVKKADEYATKDRLHNFKVAAALESTTVRQALAGMMAKHTVSVYDMCQSAGAFPMEMWDEKITDHLNYLFLLKAVVHEEWTTSNRDQLLFETNNKI